VQALQQSFRGDLTSFQGMLNYERSLRTAMGKLEHKWPTGLKLPKAMMLAHNFIPEEAAPEAEGWDPANPNGFGAGEANETNPNGVPGYTYTTNGEDVGVEDKGPGYYQVRQSASAAVLCGHVMQQGSPFPVFRLLALPAEAARPALHATPAICRACAVLRRSARGPRTDKMPCHVLLRRGARHAILRASGRG